MASVEAHRYFVEESAQKVQLSLQPYLLTKVTFELYTNVSTQARKLPIRVWSSPVRVQVPELVWGSSCLGPGLVLSFLSLRSAESSWTRLSAPLPLM